MTAIVPFATWLQGTTQPSTPVNDNALRAEVMARSATSVLSAPPASPADGQVHILGPTPSGAWASFAQHDVVLWRAGTWYRFAPFRGWIKELAGAGLRVFDGTAWVSPLERPVLEITADLILSAAHRGVTLRKSGATLLTVTIAAGLEVGTTVRLRNANATGNIVVARATGVALRIAGSATDANANVTPWGDALLHIEAPNVAVISGVGVTV